MKNFDAKSLVLIAMQSFLLACNSGGGGGGNSPQVETSLTETDEAPVAEPDEKPTFEIETGSVQVSRVDDEEGRFVGYVYEHSDGDIELFVTPLNFGPGPFFFGVDVFVEGEKYEDAIAGLTGFLNVGTLFAAGFDGAGNKFAVYDTFLDGLDGYPLVAVSKNDSLAFDNVLYGYSYIADEQALSSLIGHGTILVENGTVSGKFGDALLISGQLDGLNIVDGVSTFTTSNGKSYVGDVEGMVFYGGPSNSRKETYGGFVSSDPSDEILYSGGWAERSELQQQ